MKTFAACLALLLSAACASTVPNDVRNAPDYILLSSPNQIRTYDFASALEPHGLHVRGTMTTAGFRPAGDIQGNGQFCPAGTDWLSLSDLRVHSASEATPKHAPYIVGCVTKSGFQPASRDIVVTQTATP